MYGIVSHIVCANRAVHRVVSTIYFLICLSAIKIIIIIIITIILSKQTNACSCLYQINNLKLHTPLFSFTSTSTFFGLHIATRTTRVFACLCLVMMIDVHTYYFYTKRDAYYFHLPTYTLYVVFLCLWFYVIMTLSTGIMCAGPKKNTQI